MATADEGLTPSRLIELPKPGIALPSPSGSHYLIPSSTYSLSTQRTTRQILLGSLSSKSASEPVPVLNDLGPLGGSAFWLTERTILYLRRAGSDKSAEDHPRGVGDAETKEVWEERARARGVTKETLKSEGVEVWARDVVDAKGEIVAAGEDYGYKVAEFPIAIGNLRVLPLNHTTSLLSFSASTYADCLLSSVAARDATIARERAGTDARIYDSAYVRHWDTWAPSEPAESLSGSQWKEGWGKKGTRVFVVRLEVIDGEKGRWGMKEGSLLSPMKGSTLQTPVEPFGDASDYDLSPSHLIFRSKDPQLPEAWHTRTPIYFVPLHPRNADDAVPRKITSLERGLGATAAPSFSWRAKRGEEGGKIAWLEMRKDGYESDRNRVMLYDIETQRLTPLSETWDRSPTHITWSEDDKTLLLTAEDTGRVKLFALDVPNPDEGDSAREKTPKKLTDEGSVRGVEVVRTAGSKSASPSLLLTRSSLTTPSEVLKHVLSSSTVSSTSDPVASFIPSTLQSSLAQGEDFWFEGAEGWRVHGFILRPAAARAAGAAEEGKKWPLAFLIHGGPQGAWNDSWSARWNPNVWVEAGYIVVAINPTGSTGYGQEFTDRIRREWGGRPFKDLQAGLGYVLDTYQEIDRDRMVALGASYGGYMVNWIQGHNDVMKFKALVCHDGIFSTLNGYYATEELYFPEQDHGATPWDDPSEYERWNPANFVGNWNTPKLIIHGGKDFRLTESEGLSVFNALQRRGVPSRLLYFESENHWVLNPKNSLVWHEEVLRWMWEWVGSGQPRSFSNHQSTAVKGSDFPSSQVAAVPSAPPKQSAFTLVTSLLSDLEGDNFDTVAEKILIVADTARNETDGSTLHQVITCIHERAIVEPARAPLYARLCRYLMEKVSSDVRDHSLPDSLGGFVGGGHLVRKYLLARCQQDYDRASHATSSSLAFVNIVNFVGELYKLGMLKDGIMHECIVNLLKNVDEPEETDVLACCALMRTAGKYLESDPMGMKRMDIYFYRFGELLKAPLESDTKAAVREVIELRRNGW